MQPLRTYLDPSCIVVDLDASDKAAALGALADLLAKAGKVTDARALEREVLERELLAPTGLGDDCAIPHARSAFAPSTAVALARLAKGVDFGAPDGSTARLVFLMAGPQDAVAIHLKLLARLARFLQDESFRRAALAAVDAEALATLIFDRDARD